MTALPTVPRRSRRSSGTIRNGYAFARGIARRHRQKAETGLLARSRVVDRPKVAKLRQRAVRGISGQIRKGSPVASAALFAGRVGSPTWKMLDGSVPRGTKTRRILPEMWCRLQDSNPWPPDYKFRQSTVFCGLARADRSNLAAFRRFCWKGPVPVGSGRPVRRSSQQDRCA